MIRVYCDTGAYRPELKQMHQAGQIELVQFHYENRNKHIKTSAPPSNPTWDEANYSWDELHDTSWNDIGRQSEKIEEIRSLIGAQNKRDIKHLDSAYLAGCKAFITSDKGDISSKSEQIFTLLSIQIFHFKENWMEFQSFCTNDS